MRSLFRTISGLNAMLQMLKIYQFKSYCKGDIYSSKTVNIILPGLMTKYR